MAGHGLVLPLLWDALVAGGIWSARQLWQVLCWGPCGFLDLPPSRLEAGSSDWILFDPKAPAGFTPILDPSLAANRPEATQGSFRGRVVASGLSEPKDWLVPVPPSW
jgi:dihydroorotase